jgi:hypothetical protein
MNKIYYTVRLTCFSALPVRMNSQYSLTLPVLEKHVIRSRSSDFLHNEGAVL